MKVLATIMLFVTLSCQAGQLPPAPIDKDDICSFCKMAISTSRYAAQIVDREGNRYKFDDVGCMFRFARERHMGASARFYVMNYANGKDWLDARTAVFVRSKAVNTPMASGIVAFADRTAAGAFNARNNGEMRTFADFMSAKTDQIQHGE